MPAETPFKKEDLAASTPPASPPPEDKVQKQLEALALGQQKLTEALQNMAERNKPEPAPQPEVDPDEKKKKWWVDPETAFQENIAPVMNQMAGVGAYILEQQKRLQYPEEFKRWGNEILGYLKKLHPSYQSNPESWDTAVMLVRGIHAKEIVSNPDLVTAFSESASPTSPPAPKTPAEQLSEAELSSARRFGVTPEQYLKQKTTMRVVT